ncbi:MAG TPA: histidine kinase [Pyrinomonadaceae bacterium]|nr:histidine kinase [Pyrinomonadaceae bacterium]
MRELLSKTVETEKRSERGWLKWVALSGFWTFIAFLYGNQTYFFMRAEGMHHSWWRIILWQLLVWNTWTALTPLILWAGRRFPIERARWKRGVLMHLPIFAVVSSLNITTFTALYISMRPFDVYQNVTTPFSHQYFEKMMARFPLDFLIYSAILGIGYALDYYDKYRERETRAAQLEAQLAQAQLETLKMQLQPHFLFNTLHAISTLVRDEKTRAAVSMIAGLSGLLRHSLENIGRQEVSLREELEFLELYLDIQQMRFSDRLKVEMEIEPATLDAAVPNLILQPLVENAIRHGISPRVAGGQIQLSTRNENGILEIKVTDDGQGLKREWRVEDSRGIGLANTKARLEQLYGAEHRFSIRNREGGGVEAMLAFPFRPAENGHE